VGAFYSPQENLAVWVSETRTCPGRGPDMFGQPRWNPAWGLNISGPGLSHRGIGLGQTCPGWGADMSDQSHWNPATELDKAEMLDMSGLWAGHVRPGSLKSG
jgi:hypothetical protein